ncbi:MAG: DJ-1 family protein, partial [Lachnospiraceae bacterium]|nr:DJ-1 family protein [Lachnospiraceae bacterium]
TYHLNNGIRQKQLAEYGVTIVNEPVVKTDNIITSYCPQTAPDVAFILLEYLIGTEKMHIVKSAMGFE